MNEPRQTVEASAERLERQDGSNGRGGVVVGQALCTLLILSDIRFFREGLAEELRREGRFATVGLAANVDEALAAADAAPQIILIDVALPDGLTAVPRLRNLSPQPQIVALALAETERANLVLENQANLVRQKLYQPGDHDFVLRQLRHQRGEPRQVRLD